MREIGLMPRLPNNVVEGERQMMTDNMDNQKTSTSGETPTKQTTRATGWTETELREWEQAESDYEWREALTNMRKGVWD